MNPVFNQNTFPQGATTNMQYRGAPATSQLAQQRQRNHLCSSTHGTTQIPMSNDWQAQQFATMPSNMGNPFTIQPRTTPMANTMPSVHMAQSQFAPATIYPQNSQFVDHVSPAQPIAYDRRASFVNYANPTAAPTRREDHHTQYDHGYSFGQIYGQKDIARSQWDSGPLQYAGHDNIQGQNQSWWLGSQQTQPQQPFTYDQTSPVELPEQVLTPFHGSEAVPLSFNDLFADERSQILFTNESEPLVGQLSAADAKPVDTMSTVTEQVQHSSQSSSEVDTAILNGVASYVNMTSPAPTLVGSSQQSHKRKRSAESNSSTSSKKSRAEKAEAKKAEKERLAAKRKAEEPPMTAEQSERDRHLREITAKLERDKRGTEEELRIYLPDDEVKSLREQFAELADIDQWSDDEFRRKYVGQRAMFHGKVGAWKDEVNRRKVAQRNSNRQKRKLARQ